MRTRFVLQILFLTATYYLNYLKRIHRKTELVEHQLRVSMKNNELFSMLELALPTMVASIYGMNVPLPIQAHAHAFSIIVPMSILLAIATTLIFRKKKYF